MSEPVACEPPAGDQAVRHRRRRGRTLLLAGAGGALVALVAMPFVHTGGRVGPAHVDVVVRPTLASDTVIGVPPFGRVIVDSHTAPVELRATIQELDVPALQRLAKQDDIEGRLRSTAEHDVGALLRRAVLRLVAVTLAAGAVTGLLIGRRRARSSTTAGRPPGRWWTPPLAGAGGALVVVSGAVGLVYATYRIDSFGEPRYTGALESAPAVVNAVKREFGDLEGIRGRLEVLAGQINELSQVATGAGAAPDPGEVRILHVSDIHLNPMGLEIARDLANTFSVKAVVDTGDLTSFGLDGEARIGGLVDQFSVPYYLIPGNHDSPENRAALARHTNLTILDGETIDIDGVRILGVADPGFTAYGGISRDAAVALRDDHAGDVARMVRRDRPDVLAVAGLEMATQSVGDVPLVISGDIHKRTEHDEDGTRLLTVGSTGATGLGSFTVEEGRPYEAEVLHFVHGTLVTLDYVTVKGPSGAFTVDRVVYGDS
jgi:predicted phosphodiesterase